MTKEYCEYLLRTGTKLLPGVKGLSFINVGCGDGSNNLTADSTPTCHCRRYLFRIPRTLRWSALY